MKIILFFIVLMLFTSFSSCSQEKKYIKSIERKVYLEDTVFSTCIVDFSFNEEYLKSSNKLLSHLDTLIISEKSDGKYLNYLLLFSNGQKREVKTSVPILGIDVFINTQGMFNGSFKMDCEDETFDVYWWYKKEDIEIIHRSEIEN